MGRAPCAPDADGIFADLHQPGPPSLHPRPMARPLPHFCQAILKMTSQRFAQINLSRSSALSGTRKPHAGVKPPPPARRCE